MANYTMRIELSDEEIELLEPVGQDNAVEDMSARELDEKFESLPDVKSWSYGAVGSEPYYDRTFTAEFDDEHIIEICWTYYDGNETNEGSYWYFAGAKYGTRNEIICDVDECDLDLGAELVEHPEYRVPGTYIYKVGGDFYIVEIL